jgi:hypothetical protein
VAQVSVQDPHRSPEDEGMTYILALVLMLSLDSTAPVAIEPHKTRESCMVAAEEANRKDERLKHPALASKGAEYVCLKIERTSI